MKLAPSFVMLVSLLTTASLHAKWSRIPILQEKPVNVAVNTLVSAAAIDSSSGIGQVDNLVNDTDMTLSSKVGAGKSFVIITFGKPLMVSSSAMVSDGIEGKIVLSASADKQGWAVLEEKVVSAADRSIEFKFAGIQAKFLKYEFILSKGGNVRALRVMGGTTDRGYALKQDAKGEKGRAMNFIGGLGGARLIYAAPKPVGGFDTAATYNKFEFPESDEKYRTLIYDMGQLRILNEFSSVHSPTPVRFEVFAFEKLPEKEDWRGRLTFNPADFNVANPVAAAEDNLGVGYIKAKPAQSVKTRYLALRWEPDFNPPSFIVDNVSGLGNMINIQAPTTRIVTINGQQYKVTVDPGNAYGAGTSQGNGTTTITPVDANGTPTGPPMVFNGTDVTINPTGIVVQTTDANGNPQNVGSMDANGTPTGNTQGQQGATNGSGTSSEGVNGQGNNGSSNPAGNTTTQGNNAVNTGNTSGNPM